MLTFIQKKYFKVLRLLLEERGKFLINSQNGFSTIIFG